MENVAQFHILHQQSCNVHKEGMQVKGRKCTNNEEVRRQERRRTHSRHFQQILLNVFVLFE